MSHIKCRQCVVSCIYESCPAYEWVTSHIHYRQCESFHEIRTSHVLCMNESRLRSIAENVSCVSRVTHMDESCSVYEWVTSHIYCRKYFVCELRHEHGWVLSCVSMSHVPHPLQEIFRVRVTSRTWMSHVLCINKSRPTSITGKASCESHVTNMDESCPVHERVTSHVNYRQDVVWESCHEYKWVMSRVWMSHVPNQLQAMRRVRVMSQIWMSHVSWWMSHIPHQWQAMRCVHVKFRTWISHVPHPQLLQAIGHVWIREVLSRIWMSHVPHVMSRIWMSQHPI